MKRPRCKKVRYPRSKTDQELSLISLKLIREVLHNLVLREATVRIGVHGISVLLDKILDEDQVECATAVLVALEFSNGRLRRLC